MNSVINGEFEENLDVTAKVKTLIPFLLYWATFTHQSTSLEDLKYKSYTLYLTPFVELRFNKPDNLKKWTGQNTPRETHIDSIA